MNDIKVNGILRKTGEKYTQGYVYYLDVKRRSDKIDTLMVLSPDGDLKQGSVHITGYLKSEWIPDIGVPAFIVPVTVEYGEDDGSSKSVVTGVLKKMPKCRTMHDSRIIASIRIITDEGTIPAVLWGDTAKEIEENFKAGSIIKVSGRLQSRDYRAKDGKCHTTYEISCKKAKLIKNS